MIGLMLAAAVASQPIDYTLSIATTPAAPEVAVTMTFTGDADGETVVELPSEWAGSKDLWKSLGAPRVSGGRLVAARTPGEWRIAHRPSARVTVRYTLADGQPGVPDAATYEKARPVVERGWIYLHGEGAFAIPKGREAATARFRWGPLPRDWRVASDLERMPVLTANQVATGVVMGGAAMRLTERRIGGRALRVAALGKWAFSDATLADRLATVMTTENAMLGAAPADYFVPMAPLTGSADGRISYGGSGRTAGFALAATDNVELDGLTRLLAHEYGHRWFGTGFGGVGEGAGPYWFTEGVNDWFAGAAMVRSGLWTPAQWAVSLNGLLRRYGLSTARDLSEAEITAQFWTNQDAMQVQYDRGNLTALLLDRSVPGGILPRLRELAARPSPDDQVARFAMFFPTVLPSARAAAAGLLPADALAPCGRIVTVDQPAYARGFEMTDDTVTSATGPAAAAGVRKGLRFVRKIANDYGNSAVQYQAEFDDGGTRRTLAWYPRGSTNVRFQRLDPTGIDTPACRALVAGSPPAP